MSFGHTETIIPQGRHRWIDVCPARWGLLSAGGFIKRSKRTGRDRPAHLREVFGEVSALTNAPRTASIQAIGHVVLQEITQRSIHNLFLKNADAMEAFAAVMATREAAHRQFSPDQAESYELALVDRMRQTFARLFVAD